jgi:MFS family permease
MNERAPSAVRALAPIVGVVFIAYLIIGLALPVLPLHVHDGLGLGPVAVGIVAGSQFVAALLSRMFAGHHADTRGPKRAALVGLSIAVTSGLAYVGSLQVASPTVAVIVLLLGRALLGVAESFIITGALTWGLALLGPQNTGKVMSWVGTALYAAYAVGAPVGTELYARHGFIGVAVAATLIPLVALPLAASYRAVEVPPRKHVAFADIAGAVMVPGIGVALSGVGFGAITTFIALLFASNGWAPLWLAFTALSVAFIVGRLLFGHLPDRLGGARVAVVCILVEAMGLVSIWLAPSAAIALAGAAVTGFGYSLVYPGLGVEAIRRAPPQSRGLAMGAYTAFLDLSLAVSGPVLGLVARGFGLPAVFLASVFAALAAAVIAWRLAGATNVRLESNLAPPEKAKPA